MLVVTSLSGQTEALTDYKSMQRVQRVNEEYSLSFLLPLTERNEHAYPLVQEESYLEYDGQTYIVKELEEKSAGMKAIKSVKAFHVYLCELDDFLEGVIGGNVTVQEAVSFVLQGKNFTFEIPDSFETKTLFNFGNKNRLALMQEIFKIFDCEIEPHNRHLIFKKQIGQRRDFQFRFKHNIKTISRHVDTTDLKTCIKGYGANGLVVTYRSPMADIYGERWADPITDEEISDEATMIEKLKSSLNDEPNISLKLDAVVLPGEVGLGDEVYTIYEPIGIDIVQRVVEYVDFPEQPKSPQVTIANFREGLSDVFLSVVNNVKEVEKQTSIARSEIKQTNEQIQLTVTKTEELDGRLTTAESQITQQANQISLTVRKDGVISAINQSPEQIAISASKINLMGAVTISALASDVKATLDSKQDYTGVVSIINGVVTADYVNALGVTARWVNADSLLGSRLYIGKNGVSQSTFLEMWTGDNGAHYIKSNQASGFRIESTGSLSLQAGSDYGIYTNGAPLVANAGLRVDGGVAQFNTDIYMGNGTTIWAKDIWRNGSAVLSVAELQSWFASNNGYINSYGFNYNYLRIANGYCSVKSTAGGLQARDGSDSVYVDMYAKSFNPTSSIQWKKDIEVYTGNALDKILSAIPKMYRFNEDDESVPKRLGLIYEESPEEIQSKGSSAIDLYAMCTLLWKAVQELFNEIQSMKRSA
ncbi:phage tail spike protein [Geobacillus stearothermophilus]|uniref:phage tail spike protein n=1 Tax=Geobacillus stearothermophilus TaxID=1422 RepID=UPI002E226E62|nr:phage tail spike protein [Geobacillus stearothermophilus]MED5043199.1 phage tail spike protein [Geobacillus stearothermophilus]